MSPNPDVCHILCLSAAMTNLCRDEVTAVLKDKIEAIFGGSFNTNGLGAVLTCGVTGIKAGLSHSPVCRVSCCCEPLALLSRCGQQDSTIPAFTCPACCQRSCSRLLNMPAAGATYAAGQNSLAGSTCVAVLADQGHVQLCPNRVTEQRSATLSHNHALDVLH